MIDPTGGDSRSRISAGLMDLLEHYNNHHKIARCRLQPAQYLDN